MPKFRVTCCLESIMGSVEVEADNEDAARDMIDTNADFETWLSDSFSISQIEEL